jgi:hypothetical protein
MQIYEQNFFILAQTNAIPFPSSLNISLLGDSTPDRVGYSTKQRMAKYR